MTGEWAVLSGLMTSQEAKTITGIPLLSYIPLLRQNTITKDQGATLIVLKPHVTIAPPSETAPGGRGPGARRARLRVLGRPYACKSSTIFLHVKNARRDPRAARRARTDTASRARADRRIAQGSGARSAASDHAGRARHFRQRGPIRALPARDDHRDSRDAGRAVHLHALRCAVPLRRRTGGGDLAVRRIHRHQHGAGAGPRAGRAHHRNHQRSDPARCRSLPSICFWCTPGANEAWRRRRPTPGSCCCSICWRMRWAPTSRWTIWRACPNGPAAR